MKAKPITQKAKCNYSGDAAPAKYMAALVNDLKGMYQSKGYIDPASAIGQGIKRSTSLIDEMNKYGKSGEEGSGIDPTYK